jgi:MFS family permease
MIGLGIIAPILPLYAQNNLAASGLWIGIIFAAFGLSRAISSPLVGRTSDVRGRKSFLIIGLLGYALSGLGYIIANNVVLLTIIRFANGFTSAMVLPISQAYVGDLTPRGREGAYMNAFMISLNVGYGMGPLLGGWMYENYSAATAFYSLAALSAVALVLVVLFLPKLEDLKNSTNQKLEKTQTIPENNAKPSMRDAFKDKYVKGIMTYRTSVSLWRNALVAFLPIFLASLFAATDTQVGIVLAVFILVGAAVQYPLGKLSDRTSKTRLTLIGMAGGAAMLFVMPLSPTLVVVILITAVAAVFGTTADAPTLALGAEAGRKYGMATVLSLYDTALAIGMVGGPLISGVFVDNLGINSVFYLWGIVSIVALILCYVDLREKKSTKFLERNRKSENQKIIEKRTDK